MSSIREVKAAIVDFKRRGVRSRRLVDLLHEAARADDVDALLDLGMFARDGLHDARGATLVQQSDRASIAYYRRAAELGSVVAMDCLATALTAGSGRSRQRSNTTREALTWYRKAVRLGGSPYNLAVTYQNMGKHRQAVRWFRKSIASGDISALLPLAYAELYGVGTRRDVAAALAKLHRVAHTKRDDVSQLDREEALRRMAQLYYDGWLVRRNWRESVKWLKRAADIGSEAAQALLRDHGYNG